MDYLKAFITKLQNLDHSRRTDTIFKDFLTLSTYAIMQPFYRSPEIEQKYINIINKYNKEQANDFSQMLALLVNALEQKFQDFLGQVYMQLNLGNVKTGPFFTPYHVSKLMAEITFIDNQTDIENQDIVTLSEPCCGSGGIIIAYIKASIIKQIQTLENRIEEAFTLKLDNVITHEFWKSQNDKWQTEKDKLKIQLDEIDKLDKEFYAKADILLGFTDNAYEYFSKGNTKQKRKILEIISDEITYKDKILM